MRSVLRNNRQFLDFDEFRSNNQYLVISGQTLESWFPERSSRLPDHGFIRYHLRLAVITTKRRRLVTTKTGCLGLVPEYVQRRDDLVVLLGYNFPVLLRPCKEGYRLLGQRYVHGLMAGEVLDPQRRERLPYDTSTVL